MPATGHRRFWRHQLLRSISAFLVPERNEEKEGSSPPLHSQGGERCLHGRLMGVLWKQSDLGLSPRCVT